MLGAVTRRIALIVTLIGLAQVAQSQMRGKSYLPLARVAITAYGNEVDALLDELVKFATERKITIKCGDLPKQGRRVVNLTMQFESDTFFTMDNFVAETEFGLNAYSNDDAKVWRRQWQMLIDRISSRLGKDHVRVVMVAPNSDSK